MSYSATPWTAACQAPLSSTISWSLLKFLFIESVMLSNHFMLCFPFFCTQSFSGSGSFPMRWVFTSRQPKYWSISFSISPSNDYSGLISFRIGLISLQSKGLARVFSSTTAQNHQLFSTQPSLVQLSHLYMTTGKIIALTIWIFVAKVMSLPFNILCRFFIAFLPRSKCLLIS